MASTQYGQGSWSLAEFGSPSVPRLVLLRIQHALPNNDDIVLCWVNDALVIIMRVHVVFIIVYDR